MVQNILTSLLAFISTNIDDIFILMLFFGGKKFSQSTIVAGQYVGIGSLVFFSFAGAYVGNFIDQRYIGLLGLFPIYLAVRQVIELIRKKDSEDNNDLVLKSSGLFAIAGVTIANGADNIGVYVPLLTIMTQVEKIQMIIVFLVMTYAWCSVAYYLASRPLIARQLNTFGHIIMPIVLLLLGIFILIESGSFTLFHG